MRTIHTHCKVINYCHENQKADSTSFMEGYVFDRPRTAVNARLIIT